MKIGNKITYTKQILKEVSGSKQQDVKVFVIPEHGSGMSYHAIHQSYVIAKEIETLRNAKKIG